MAGTDQPPADAGGKDKALLDVLSGLKDAMGKGHDSPGAKDGPDAGGVAAMLAKAGASAGGAVGHAAGALGGVAGQGRPSRKSSDDADGLKWSRRAGAFAGEFVKTVV